MVEVRNEYEKLKPEIEWMKNVDDKSKKKRCLRK